jgi:short-subunit dehydrogenase
MKNYCLITGASSGIGKEFAKRLASKYNLILVARREERLLELKRELDTEVIIKCADLSKKDNIDALYNAIKEYKIEMFINNAGFGLAGDILETDIDKEIQMIDVNVKALYILDKLILKKMKEDNIKGYVLNVGSIAGILRCGPYMSQYYATKSYVVSLTLGIRRELKENKSGIYIGCLCPGPVNTEFNDVAEVSFSLKGVSTERVVDYAIKKMLKKKPLIVPTFSLKLLIFFRRFISNNFLARIVAKQQKKKLN